MSDAFKRIFIVDDCQTWQRDFYEWTISPTFFSNLLSQTWGDFDLSLIIIDTLFQRIERVEGERILEYALAFDLLLGNTCFKKRDSHLITTSLEMQPRR